MRNVELKARRQDPARDRRTCTSVGAVYKGRLRQRDTYFRVSSGRLKLREQSPGRAELIAYMRPDRNRARVCDYAVIPLADPRLVRTLLDACLGTLAEVRKVRELFLRRGVRIHLDRVRGLGSFLEFEAVLARGRTAAWGRRQITILSEAFGITGADIVSGSYLDLTVARNQ